MLRIGREQARSRTTAKHTMSTEAYSVNQGVRRESEEVLLEEIAQMLHKSGKQFSIERLKALGAITYKGNTK